MDSINEVLTRGDDEPAEGEIEGRDRRENDYDNQG